MDSLGFLGGKRDVDGRPLGGKGVKRSDQFVRVLFV